MTFEAFETADGSPVELITFRNGVQTFRYTNANNNVTVGANEYLVLEYKRTAPSVSKDSDDSQIRIQLPATNPVVALYREILSSNISTITIERFHDDDPDEDVQVFWKGQVGSVTTNNAISTILAIPFTEGTDEIPRYTYQGLCNYFLYEGATCRIVRNDFRHLGVVSGLLTPQQVTVNGLRATAVAIDATFGSVLTPAELDEYWLSGYCIANNEIRRIVQNPSGGSPEDPDTIAIPFPFINLSTGDDIEVFAGCRRNTDICTRKFDNILNYGGWPTVPNVNPFTTELPKGKRNATVPTRGQGQGFW